MTVQNLIDKALRQVGEESTYGYDTAEWILWANEAQRFVVSALEPQYLLGATVVIQDAILISSTGDTGNISLLATTKKYMRFVSLQAYRAINPQIIYYKKIEPSEVSYYRTNILSVSDKSPICWIEYPLIWFYEGTGTVLGTTRKLTYITEPINFALVGDVITYTDTVGDIISVFMAAKAKQKMEDYNEADKLLTEAGNRIQILNSKEGVKQ